MKRLSIFAVTAASLLTLGTVLPAGKAVGQEKAQQTSDVERVNAASQVFIAAMSARDIRAMERVWVHESYATFIGPLSTTVVVGWDGVKKAWEMRFDQFDRVTSRWRNLTFTPMGRSRGRLASRKYSCYAKMAAPSTSMPS